MTNQKGKNNYNWKGGKPKCLVCQKQLVNYRSKRCASCALKYNYKIGKLNLKGKKLKRPLPCSYRFYKRKKTLILGQPL